MMVRANSNQFARVVRYRARLVGLAVVVVLATGGVVAGCSTGGGGGLSSACQNARQRFSGALDAELTADTAVNHAQTQWANANPATLQGPGLTTAIGQYNVDLQTAQTARATAAQRLAAAEKAITTCKPSSLPKACRAEFAQFQPIIDNTTSARQAEAAITQAIASEQQARLSGNVGAFNSAVNAQNAAVTQHNDFTNTYNVALKEAFNAAVRACNKAEPGGAQASTMPPAFATPSIPTTTTSTTTTTTTRPPSPASSPEGAIAAYLSSHGLSYGGDCRDTNGNNPADIGKYCSSLQQDNGSTRTYLVGPVASEGKTFVVARQGRGWRVTSPAS